MVFLVPWFSFGTVPKCCSQCGLVNLTSVKLQRSLFLQMTCSPSFSDLLTSCFRPHPFLACAVTWVLAVHSFSSGQPAPCPGPESWSLTQHLFWLSPFPRARQPMCHNSQGPHWAIPYPSFWTMLQAPVTLEFITKVLRFI